MTLEMRVLLLLCGSFSGTLGGYMPGTPGADWSLEEVLLVKAKLWRMFSSDQAVEIVKEGTPASPGPDIGEYEGARGVFGSIAPKALRQGFHDCLKYEDGTGGCDGCLGRRDVGHQRVPHDHDGYLDRPDVKDGDNNGMQVVSDILEGIYTNKDFPSRTPSLQASLQESGKSRADLWALAAMTAVEFGISTNNMRCRNITSEYNEEGCSFRDEEEDCRCCWKDHSISKLEEKTVHLIHLLRLDHT